jgi:transcriptional regulator with XRE-family HTH domain
VSARIDAAGEDAAVVPEEGRIDAGRIAGRVVRRRERLGLKQLELAARAGLSEAYVNRLENGGVRNPKVNDLARVARALGLPLEALLAGAGAGGGAAPRAAADVAALLARQPRVAVALASLARGLQAAEPEDREFVLGHLESLARRFGDRPDG